MAENKEKRRPGHPGRHSAERLQTKVWYYVIVSRFSNLAAYKLERMFFSETFRVVKGVAILTGNFQKYKHGQQFPKDDGQESSLISRVDKAFPGTAAVFRSPIWKILKGKQVDTPTIQQSMADLGEIISLLFLEPPAKYKLDGVLIKDFSVQDFARIQD